MSSTETRSGFRLPWTSDRAHDGQPGGDPTELAAGPAPDMAPGEAVWPDIDVNARLDMQTTQPRPHAPLPEEQPRAAADQPPEDPALQEPAMPAIAPVPPAPVAPRRPSKLMADLSAAIRATADAARIEVLADNDADVAAVVAEIRATSKEGEIVLKHRADEDVAEIRDWSKAEIARIKEETEARIEARKAQLGDEIAAHAAAIETRVGAVESLAASYRNEMEAYAERLAQEDDPSRLATMAESMPDAPELAGIVAADLADLPQLPVKAEAGTVDVEASAGEADVEADVEAAGEADVEAVVEAAGEADVEADVEAAGEADVEVEVGEAPALEAVESDVEADDEADVVAAVAAAAEAVDLDTPTHTGAPFGSPTPWAVGDEYQPRADHGARGSDVPRWAAGETVNDVPQPVDGSDPVDRGAIMAALEAAAAAVVAAESAADSADQAEAAADVAETAAELVVGRTGSGDDLDPEAQAALSARVDAGGFDTESFTDRLASLMPGHDPAVDDGSVHTTQVIVSGLVSVASIASFKRHLGRIAGVDGVAVASGPGGEFVFNVTHRADVSFRDALPTLPGFAARVTSTGDGIVTVMARDPEAEG